MELLVLWDGFFASVIMRAYRKESSDSNEHCFDKYSDGIGCIWNSFPDNMHSLKGENC